MSSCTENSDTGMSKVMYEENVASTAIVILGFKSNIIRKSRN